MHINACNTDAPCSQVNQGQGILLLLAGDY
jgi:hypothetical protein